MTNNENYNLIKKLIKEKSLIELSCVLRIAGYELFKDKEEIEPHLYETYFLMVFLLKFLHDSDMEENDFKTLTSHINEQFLKIDRILNPPIKKRHLTLVKS
jgi:hypothetical protein